jgi:hypothetical protein
MAAPAAIDEQVSPDCTTATGWQSSPWSARQMSSPGKMFVQPELMVALLIVRIWYLYRGASVRAVAQSRGEQDERRDVVGGADGVARVAGLDGIAAHAVGRDGVGGGNEGDDCEELSEGEHICEERQRQRQSEGRRGLWVRLAG